ncbi:hypothetical protein Moror_3513 [Moniliophthora roreri MCA 2997]|uniref:Uncharacterized protein n=1 Tax=Moniliophthora roreri (strain MCA 2997) TaxID=1381753 RepID=V2W5K1_MONRO|nr:hypothetical protein Moror_3513 [Moniliophthora roreri MCA 2997]
MSDSAKVCIVCEYLEKLDKGNTIGAHAYVTDDFSHNHNTSPGAQTASYAAGPSLSKDEHHQTHKAIHNNFQSVKTVVDSVKESRGKVQVRAKTQFELKVKEVPFTAEYEFEGDKISTVHVSSDSSFVYV